MLREPPFINETEAIKEEQLAGEKILPTPDSLDASSRQSGSGIVGDTLKLAGKAFAVGKIIGRTAKLVGSVATGPLGKTISNVLSRALNKNP